MSSDTQKVPNQLDCSNLAKEWPKWKKKFLNLMRATGKMTGTDLDKTSALLWYMGDRGEEIFDTLYPNDGDIASLFVEPEENEEEGDEQPAALTFDDVLGSFDDYCLPQKNLAIESFKFHTIMQKEKQNFAEFETELRTQMKYCEFDCESCGQTFADRMLRDRIIVGIHDKKLQLKLLDGRDEALLNVIEKCKVYEVAYANKRLLEKGSEKVDAKVDAVDAAASSTDVVRKYNCFNCGRPFAPNHLENCPAKDVDCRSCGKRDTLPTTVVRQNRKERLRPAVQMQATTNRVQMQSLSNKLDGAMSVMTIR